MPRLSYFLLLPLLSTACTETVDSQDIRTSGIYPHFAVSTDGSGSSVASARLRVGGDDSNTYVDLQSGDHIEVTAGEQTQRLRAQGDHVYAATFATDDPSVDFVFALVRGTQDDSAPNSVVRLPQPFDVAMGSTSASRATDEVVFSWDGTSSADLEWEVDGDCLFVESGSTPDDGNHSLGSQDVRALGTKAEESCTASLTLERRASGTLDPAFVEGGRILGIQSRESSFTSTP